MRRIETLNSESENKERIRELVKIFKERIEGIANRSLKHFADSYNEHPGFRQQKSGVPFLEKDKEKIKEAPDNLEKIVFLLGAGTSESAGIPMANIIIEDCKTALGKNLLMQEIEKIREEESKPEKGEKSKWVIELVDSTLPYTFEEVLTAFRNLMGENEVLQLLRNYFLVDETQFQGKTLITLFNECLAHLTREHLIDFIVTFNFDELLELSLDEDIGPHSYVKVSSPAMFQWAVTHGLTHQECTSPNQRPAEKGCEQAKVWLIKPHGTISQENTLRHLIEHVWHFEDEKKETLKKVFKNSYVVVVGYSLSAVDLHRILLPHAMSGFIKKLFWVDPASRISKPGQNLRKVMEKVQKGSFLHICMRADEFALELFQEIYSKENQDLLEENGLFPPYRHFLRAFVFQRNQRKPKDQIPCTFDNRFILELVNYCIRMLGWFSSRVIIKCHQIKHLLDCAAESQKKILSDLPQKLKPFMVSVCRQGRAERIYLLRKEFQISSESDDVKKFVKMVYQCIPDRMKTVKNANRKPNSNIAKAARTMGELIREIPRVATYFYYDEIATFKNILLIPNKPVLTAITRWLLKQKNLYIVSEIGGVLSHSINNIKHISIGDYKKEKESIEAELKKHNILISELYLEDIERAANEITKIEKKFGRNKCFPIPPHKKRIHFTLAEFHEKDKPDVVSGILFPKMDRQAGTTFYWIMLEMDNRMEKEQFEALKSYMGCKS